MKTNSSYLFSSALCMLGLAALTAVQAQSLPVTNGLALWLRSDTGVTTNTAGQVVGWADQSGLGNNASAVTATAPTILAGGINGLPVINFPGSKFMDVANSPSLSILTNDVTVLTVVSYNDLTSYRCVVNKCLGNKPAPFDFWSNNGSSSGRTTFWLGNGTVSTPGLVGIAAPQVNVFTVMGGSWKNGVLDQHIENVSNGRFNYTAALADNGGTLRIGQRADGTAVTLKGKLAEVLIYQPALSDSDRLAVTDYLRSKYALIFNEPPLASILTPTNGTTLAAPATIPVTVNATDDSRVARLDIYKNGQLLGSATAPPYTMNVTLLNPGTAVFTAVATDNGSPARTGTSAPVAITVTGIAPVAPVTTGLKVWLSADAGVTTNASGLVTTWADQSGNGNDAVQTNETAAPLFANSFYNGKPALVFATNAFSTNQFLEIADSGTAFTVGDLSTFAVARFTDFVGYRVVWTKASAGFAAPVDWWFQNGSGRAGLYRGYTNSYASVLASVPAPAGDMTTAGALVSGTNITHSLGFITTGVGAITNVPVNDGLPLRIGRRDEGGTQMKGEIAEILIYNRGLGATDASNVVSYLSSKYGRAEAVVEKQMTVAITSPANGASFAAPAVTTLSATATDASGVITRVDLLANGFTMATFTNAPYQIALDMLTPGAIAYTAVAINNWGQRATSAPVVITVTGAMPTTPLTNDLRVWLSADTGVTADSSGLISQWDDQSGNLSHAYQGNSQFSPTLVPGVLGGKPVVRFNTTPATNYLDIYDNTPVADLTNNITAFALLRPNSFSGKYLGILEKTSANLPRPFDWLITGLAARAGQTEIALGAGGTPAKLLESFSGKATSAGFFQTVSVTVSDTSVTHGLNFDDLGSSVLSFAPENASGFALRIGSRDDLATQMNGDIAELLVYGRALTHDQKVQVLNYLNGKYAIPVVRIANAPPTVTITNPTNGASASVSEIVSVLATAADPENALTSVDLMANGAVIGSSTAAPFRAPLQALSPGTITLTARATDVWGAVGTSAPVVITITGAPLASAPPATSLMLWLKADTGVQTNADGTVYWWTDQSGNGNDAQQGNYAFAPLVTNDVVSGITALDFETEPAFLDVTNVMDLTGDLSLFYVANVADFAGNRGLMGRTAANLPRPLDYFFTAGNGFQRMVRGNTDGYTGVSGTRSVPSGKYFIGGTTVDAGFVRHYQDFTASGTGSFGYGALDTGNPLRIGNRDDLATQFKGQIAEILMYNRLLTGSDLAVVNTYLASRSGISVFQVPQQPKLTVTSTGPTALHVSWPVGFNGFVLEGRTNLTAGSWRGIVTNPPSNDIAVTATNVMQYFRLRSQ